jgi:flagellar basal-body rod protein FlgF
MENNLLIGLSRQMVLQRELDVIANNIANVNTTGFKADGNVFEEFINPTARSDKFAPPDRRLSFVIDRATWHDLSSGPVQQTGNPVDVAIDGMAFLAVQTPQGERYTRNGALQINATGELVTSEGYQVVGESGPIVFQNTDRDITINPDGSIRVREGANATADSSRGKLRIVDFQNPQQLQKDGSSLFDAGTTQQPRPTTDSRVVQGAVEKSNVQGVLEMTRLIEVTRSYTEVSAILQQQSEMRRDSISRLADVPA